MGLLQGHCSMLPGVISWQSAFKLRLSGNQLMFYTKYKDTLTWFLRVSSSVFKLLNFYVHTNIFHI